MIYRSRPLVRRLQEACGWAASCLGSTAANPAPSEEQCRPRSTHQVNIWCDAAVQKEAIVTRQGGICRQRSGRQFDVGGRCTGSILQHTGSSASC